MSQKAVRKRKNRPSCPWIFWGFAYAGAFHSSTIKRALILLWRMSPPSSGTVQMAERKALREPTSIKGGVPGNYCRAWKPLKFF